nr:MAG TPA: hypothetical protein [Caudoviricetes sp.]
MVLIRSNEQPHHSAENRQVHLGLFVFVQYRTDPQNSTECNPNRIIYAITSTQKLLSVTFVY